MATCTQIFAPHPNLSDRINHDIAQSEIEGGVFLDDLQSDDRLTVWTQNHVYTVEMCGQNQALISGHPRFCPEPILVRIEGSTWGGSALKRRFIGRGMCLEFRHAQYPTPIVTSRIVEIRQCEPELPCT